MQTKTMTNMKHEWANGFKARSHSSVQVLHHSYCMHAQDFSFLICINMFSIFNLQHNI